jgi:hypothetical protein
MSRGYPQGFLRKKGGFYTTLNSKENYEIVTFEGLSCGHPQPFPTNQAY